MEREAILERIKQMKSETNDFSATQMRWKNKEVLGVPIQKLNYDMLDGIDLVQAFEMTCIYFYRGY